MSLIFFSFIDVLRSKSSKLSTCLGMLMPNALLMMAWWKMMAIVAMGLWVMCPSMKSTRRTRAKTLQPILMPVWRGTANMGMMAAILGQMATVLMLRLIFHLA
jgi:hypothetical protein